MEDFIILKNNNSPIKYICFMNTIEDIEYCLEDIKNEMAKLGQTKILIDLFLSNGYSYNRFFEFNLLTQDLSLVNPRNVDIITYNTINIYLRNNIEVLDNSALSLSLKSIIMKQLQAVKA